MELFHHLYIVCAVVSSARLIGCVLCGEPSVSTHSCCPAFATSLNSKLCCCANVLLCYRCRQHQEHSGISVSLYTCQNIGFASIEVTERSRHCGHRRVFWFLF